MGLTVHIHARAGASLSQQEISGIVARWHAAAQVVAAEGRLIRVFEPSEDPADLKQFAVSWCNRSCADDPSTTTATEVRPSEGCIFLIQPGAGCEPLVLGLCRYPAEFEHSDAGESDPDEWQLTTSCKTQYASLHGWEHFLRCHTAVIELAALGSSLGVEVRIEDEGDYWPQRDETTLRATLERLNRAVAGLAGALKDAAGDAPEQAVRSPILGHSEFERLEAEAAAGPDAGKIAEAVRRLRDSTAG